MTDLEMVEKISEKTGATLEEAKAALEACDWDMLDAALMLERERGEAAASVAHRERGLDEEKPSRRSGHVLSWLGKLLKRVLDVGNRNRFEVRRRNSDELVLDMPLTALALLLIFAFWVCVPLLVIGLFTGFRYSFSGVELGRESINRVMDKASETANKVLEDFRRGD